MDRRVEMKRSKKMATFQAYARSEGGQRGFLVAPDTPEEMLWGVVVRSLSGEGLITLILSIPDEDKEWRLLMDREELEWVLANPVLTIEEEAAE